MYSYRIYACIKMPLFGDTQLPQNYRSRFQKTRLRYFEDLTLSGKSVFWPFLRRLANILHLLRHISFKRSAFESHGVKHRARDYYCAKSKGHWCMYYGGPGGRATKHCTTSGFLIEQYSDRPIPCSSNGAAVRFCDRSHSAIKRSSTSATALTSIDLFLGSNNGLYLGSNNDLFLRSNSGPFLRPTSQTYYGIYRWYLA